MRYWVYKDARILGPFDKNDVAGLPGLDASTLVCAGESAAAGEGDWRPAGDIADLAALPFDRGAPWPADGLSSTFGLLDKLQIDVAGLIGDGEFPGAAEDLFQDAEMKRTFGDLLAPRRAGADEAELRRAKDRAVELTAQLELLYKRVAELEAGQTQLVHRLAEKEMQLRSNLETSSSPAPVAPPASSTPASVPPPMTAPVWPSGGGAAFPSFSALGSTAPAFPPSPASLPPVPPPAALVPAPPPAVLAPAPASLPPAPPPVPSKQVPGPVSSVPPIAAGSPVSEPSPKKALFEKKSFKIFPAVKSFRVVGADEDRAAGEVPAQEALLPAAPAPVPIALQAAFPAPPPATAPPLAAPPPAQAPATSPPEPPTTLSFGASAPAEPSNRPIPIFSIPGAAADGAVEEEGPKPPSTAVFKGADDMAGASSTEDALARLAKPAPESEVAPPRAPRSNKPFLIGAAALVIVMAVVGALFLRHPKDLKQMAELDDGRARVGAEATDDASHLPMVKPQMAAPQMPAPPAVEAPQAASQAKLDAAVAAVKDFPLDGERGTVAQWLQFSYSAGPDAGKESWSASETAGNTYLVEYRFTPATHGDEVHYLFEVDMDRGFVIGKNLDAKSVLAGGSGVAAAKAKLKPKAKPRKRAARRKKKAAKRAVEDVSPKEVPLLPLPSEGELRPPAEDDGAFTSDTVNSGL